ncbi:hypothetical protein LEP1GSC035_0411 [Leptospira noguchii str. 2007001578]|uniref:Uncharacterized protein n=1 Tax=Leptospira noguchii str. 2007001578 TaxID=1049974 RepID=A0ABN0IUP7_9LEPT|nr:hypothetical protein LEP1GSC035_0411 [Leptospira noguchii str. 2007001578]
MFHLALRIYLSLKEEIKHNFIKGRESILQDIEKNLFFLSKN